VKRTASAARTTISGVGATVFATVLATAALLAGCGSPTSDTAHLVSSWGGATNLSSGIATIRADAANVLKVEATKNPGAIRTNCAVLDLDTENANQNLPAPVHQLTVDLTDAYTAEIQAAQDCFHGAGKSIELINRGQIAQSAAYEDLNQALALYNQLLKSK
jgi:outer membrane murein-binding lipoprotein Lpp